MRFFLGVPLLALTGTLALAGPSAHPGAAQGRLRPAEFVTCDRNHLTSFTGRVVSLTRNEDSTTLRMETDEGTKERFTLRHKGSDPTAWFFVAGRPLVPADWDLVMPAGRLRPGARATVWVCDDEPNPKVDWAPFAPERR